MGSLTQEPGPEPRHPTDYEVPETPPEVEVGLRRVVRSRVVGTRVDEDPESDLPTGQPLPTVPSRQETTL